MVALGSAAMRRLLATTWMLTAGLMVSGITSQSVLSQSQPKGSPRLLDSIEAPYAYVSLGSIGNLKESAPQNAVRKLLADPSLDAVFGGGKQGGGSQALSLVRGMLSRGAIELELAMTGIVGRQGTPLLVLRARLRPGLARNLRAKLEETTQLAIPSRKLGGHQTYTLKNNRGRPRDAKVGQTVELAMVGDDLIVGNDGSAMREVLEPLPNHTSAQPVRRVLSADPRFRSLRKRLDVPKGSLFAYGDWRRLGRRLQSSLIGASAQLLSGSGLGSARSIMMTIAPAKKDGFAPTLLLDFDVDTEAGAADARIIKGWFAATQPVAAKQLVRELPRGGLGGLVLSVDLMAVADNSPRSSHMVWDLRDAYTSFGLDYGRNLIGRLASRGTVQMHFGPQVSDKNASSTEVTSGSTSVCIGAITAVYSVRAKSRTAAADIFSDLRRVVESTNFGKFVVAKDAKGKRQAEVIHLSGAQGQMSAFVCVHEDTLLLAESQETLVQVLQEMRRSRPARRNSFVTSAVKSIGGGNVAGLFDLDLNPLIKHISSALNGVDLSALPKRHIGYLDTDTRQDGAVVRIRLLSSR